VQVPIHRQVPRSGGWPVRAWSLRGRRHQRGCPPGHRGCGVRFPFRYTPPPTWLPGAS